MTGSVIVIFLAIALVWAIVGPTPKKVETAPRRETENKIPKKETEGPPNVINHTPKRKKELPPEEERTEALDTFKRLKEASSTVRFN